MNTALSLETFATNQAGQDVIDQYAALARSTEAQDELEGLDVQSTIADIAEAEMLAAATYRGVSPEKAMRVYNTILGAYFAVEQLSHTAEEHASLWLKLDDHISSLAGRTALVRTIDGSPSLKLQKFERAGRKYVTTATLAAGTGNMQRFDMEATEGLILGQPKRFAKPYHRLRVPVVDSAGTPLIHLHIED